VFSYKGTDFILTSGLASNFFTSAVLASAIQGKRTFSLIEHGHLGLASFKKG
jgi:hypothetical protein